MGLFGKGLEKAMIYYDIDGDDREITVMFNPSEYGISASVDYAEQRAPGTDNLILQFVSQVAQELKMTLYFDTYSPEVNLTSPTKMKAQLTNMVKGEREDVRNYTDKIMELIGVAKELHAPPVVTFVWGSLYFQGRVTSVNQSFTMFLPSGIPVRARVDVTFMQHDMLDSRRKSNPLESPDRAKQRTLKGLDQLWSMSAHEYDDPGLWRVIAKENGILNPRKVKPGMILKVPSIT